MAESPIRPEPELIEEYESSSPKVCPISCPRTLLELLFNVISVFIWVEPSCAPELAEDITAAIAIPHALAPSSRFGVLASRPFCVAISIATFGSLLYRIRSYSE